MAPMPASLRSFWITLIAGWIALGAAGVLYARLKFVPPALAVPIAAAFLLEFSFYLLPGFAAARERLERSLTAHVRALALALSALAPYLLYSLLTGQFRIAALARLALLAAAVAFWYVIRRPSVTADLAFLLLLAAPVLSRFFERIYTSPLGNIDVAVLGKLMLIRLAATIILTVRRAEGIGFGFLPEWREWKVGIVHYLMFVPIGFSLAAGIGLLRFEPFHDEAWKVAAIFAGMLWVVALSEEFYFRGLLQNWIAGWTGRPQLALAIASVLFGLAHLGFRTFPNWRFALVAAVAGWFYGRAYRRAGGIRAAMVAHALTNVTARVFFV
jgi:membrane protease YdiL (CAAX protease family)